MPTTNDEAAKIIEISTDYLYPEELQELFGRLWDEVGAKSENDSVKQSVYMMREITKDLAAPKSANCCKSEGGCQKEGEDNCRGS